MSDREDQFLNDPDETQDDFSSMSLDELIASTKEEIARVDRMMGTGRQTPVEEAEDDSWQDGVPDEAADVSQAQPSSPEASAPQEPQTQSEPFEPKLPEEYADLSLDADEPEQQAQVRIWAAQIQEALRRMMMW